MYTSSLSMAQPSKSPSFVTMWIVVTLCVASLWLFRGLLIWNETSRMAVARHFVDPNWIPGDWFLNNADLYQIPFNLFAAPFVALLDLGTATILLRFILYAWFASGVVALARRLGIGLLPLIPAVMMTVAMRTTSLAAAESMVGHAETKTLAYGAVFWAFSMLFSRRYRTAAAFLGLATTFHVLVGLYATITTLLFLLTHSDYRYEVVRSLAVSIPVYLTTGAFGVFVVLDTLISSASAENFPDLVYIARNDFHLWPPAWWKYSQLHLPGWIDEYAWQVRVVIAISFLSLVSVWSRVRRFREIAHLALLSSLSFGVGLLIYAAGQIGLLKYYPFRFPDVFLPFASFVLFFGIWDMTASHHNVRRLKPLIRKSLRIALYAVVGFMVVYAPTRTAKHLQATRSANVPWQYVRLSPEEREATQWIRDNTPADALFLVDPYFEAFYITAERGVMVAWKHVPTGNADFIEWHARLVAINGGRKIILDSVNLDREGIQRSFNEMSLDSARELAQRYGLDYYYGPYRDDWEIPPLFRSGEKAIYRLP